MVVNRSKAWSFNPYRYKQGKRTTKQMNVTI